MAPMVRSITHTNVWSAAQHPSPASGFEDKGNGSLFIKTCSWLLSPSSLGNDLPALDSYISSHIHVSLVWGFAFFLHISQMAKQCFG